MSDTRANKPRMNLLHFIVQVREITKLRYLARPVSYMLYDNSCLLQPCFPANYSLLNLAQIAEDKKEELMEFPDKMTDILQAACRLNIDNLEKEVNILKLNLESTKKSLKKAPADVKEQMGSFLKVKILQHFFFFCRRA